MQRVYSYHGYRASRGQHFASAVTKAERSRLEICRLDVAEIGSIKLSPISFVPHTGLFCRSLLEFPAKVHCVASRSEGVKTAIFTEVVSL